MTLRSSIRTLREDDAFREKISEMATEFCLEASVLISVLGILEAAIAWKGFPPLKDILFSGSIGGAFFLLGCMIQVQRMRKRHEAELAKENEP